MTTTSNSYAEKVFSEHPIALWSLDEQVDYVSLITEDDRNMSNSWVFKNQANQTLNVVDILDVYTTTTTWLPNFPNPVFESVANQITVPNKSTGTGYQVKATSPVIAQQSDFDITVKTFSIGAYVNTFNRRVNVDLGYEYTDENSQVVIETHKAFLLNTDEWQFVSETFELPDTFSNLKIVINIDYDSPTSDYYVLIHGMSIGQWSETFHVESLGVNPLTIPSTVSIAGTGAGAKTYGLQDISGYYLTHNNRFCARNSGLPMVYGAESSTVITPNAEWTISNNSYDEINWISEDIDQPSREEVLKEIERLQTEYNNLEYQRLRAEEYPPMADYLDGIVKGNQEQIQAYIDACQAVKDKYPKPQS